MENTSKLKYSSVLCLFLWSISSSNDSDNVEFKMDYNIPENGVLKLMEGTHLNFTFNNSYNLTQPGLFIKIKTLQKGKVTDTDCMFYMDCSKTIYNKTCRCLFPGGPYQFTKTVHRTDDKAIYMWLAEDKNFSKLTQRNVTFNVTYSSRVTNLTVDNEDGKNIHLVLRNESFTVVCHWENGNPPTIPRLLDSEGNNLKNTTNNGTQVVGQHSVLQCHIIERIRCEADGSERNKSVTVLTKCPPQFDRDYGQVQTVNSENAVLSFRLQAHTPTITKCGITQLSQQLTINSSAFVENHYKDNNMNVLSMNKSCTNMSKAHSHVHECLCHVNGTVPNLTLHVYFRNLVQSDGGLWLLHLSNDIGSDSIIFNIMISSRSLKSTDVPMLVGIVGGVVILILIAVIIRVVIKQKETRRLEKRKDSNCIHQNRMFTDQSKPRSDLRPIAMTVIGNGITCIAGKTDIVKPALCAYEDVADMMPLNRNCSRSHENIVSRDRSNYYADIGVASATGREDGSETESTQANVYNTLATKRQVGSATDSSRTNVYNTSATGRQESSATDSSQANVYNTLWV